jgi:hypothetical protein
MRPTLSLCAIVTGLCSSVALGNQAAPAATLSETLRAHVKEERFQIVTSVRGLPLGVREELQSLFGSGALDIADPDSEFNAKAPGRRLLVAGCSADHCLVYYERGGSARSWQVALFHWTPAATRLETGGIAAGGLTTIDQVRNAVLSGAIKGPNPAW